MIKSIIFLTLFLSQIVFSQNQLTETQKIERFIHVWGLLKYQHPDISRGKWDMNTEFITEFDAVTSIENQEQLNSELITWIRKFSSEKSKFKTNPNRINSTTFTKNADFNWIENSGFSPELISLLKEIQNNSNIGDYYASINGMNKMLAFQNEKGLDNFQATSKSHRMLFICSFWNAMKYWNPNLYLTDQPWPRVLTEMIPDFNQDDALQFESSKEKLFSKLNDSHSDYSSSYLFDKKLNHFAPVGGRIINDSMVVTRLFNKELAQKNNIGLGDVIVSIDTRSVKDYYTDKFSNSVSASNPNYLRFAIENSFLLAGESPDSVQVGIIKKDGSKSVQFLKRYPKSNFTGIELYKQLEKPIKENWYKLSDDVGYLNLKTITKSELKMAFEEFKNTKGIVIDLRNYPQAITEAELPDFLYPEKKVFIKVLGVTSPGYGEYDIQAPLKLLKNPFMAGSNNKEYYKGKIVLLVNRTTASKAEFIGMAIQQSPNCLTIGEQTFGAVMNRNRIPLIDKTTIDYTVMGAFYPDNSGVQRNGLKIDYEVKESAVNYNPDVYLEKAMEMIQR